ncbi:MAG: hypothetical protein K0S53_668 [Bacteroidetes bacterium]|jgi:hypothetical protein|nr:hypothetical protein [Bacteroidota bacterium]
MKIKSIVAVLLIASSLPSCKKQYTCECTTMYSISGQSSTETTGDTYSEKMKEKQADAACDETEAKLSKASKDHAADVEYFSGETTTATTTCKLK